MKTHHFILLIIAALFAVGFFLWPRINTPTSIDELTGTWRASASPESEYQWWMVYEFENGGYSLTTDSSYTEEGSYEITQRFLDGSILVKKVYADGAKEYEMTVLLSSEDPNTISIDGTNLYRQ